MTRWLLDTNVLSELRPEPNEKVVTFVAGKPLDRLFVSIVTFAEIRVRIQRRGRYVSRRIERLGRAQGAADVRRARAPGQRRRDIQMAAARRRPEGRTHLPTRSDHRRTALHYGVTVGTRDTGDFEKARVPVLNPWHEARER